MTHAVLLTAAVTPDPRFRVALSDTEQRLRQYAESIGEWLSFAQTMGAVVVVVETSQSTDTLRAHIRRPGDRLEILDYVPSATMVEKGKGSVEAGAIDHAVGVLAGKGVTAVTKVTGRLRVTNARDVLAPLDPNSVMVRRTLDRRYVDSRLIHASTDVWTGVLHDMALELNDASGTYLEHVAALRLIRAEHERGTSVMRFPRRPRFRGQSGTSGGQYGGVSNAVRSAFMERLEGLVERMAKKQI